MGASFQLNLYRNGRFIEVMQEFDTTKSSDNGTLTPVKKYSQQEAITEAVKLKLGTKSKSGAFVVSTGKFTGRSPGARFVVKNKETENTVAWGNDNQPIDSAHAKLFWDVLKRKLSEMPTYAYQGFVGGILIDVQTSSPWHAAFAHNMFRTQAVEAVKKLIPSQWGIKIYHIPNLKPSDLGLDEKLEAMIILDAESQMIGIVGTSYAGEIKKSAFSMCNYLLPKLDILPMHSSANCIHDGSQSSVLFGLSGTGKTTLSAAADRELIGDDEIIWTETGISNLEGGCYAKLIALDPEKEPDIYRAVNQPGAILENVMMNDQGIVDYDDDSKTENTRGSYCLSTLSNVFNQKQEAQPPKAVIFLMADAFGAMPAVARLNPSQAQYHFMSGYTAKVAGTEIGVTEPKAAFSACFGAPFMPRPVAEYAKMLTDRMDKHNTSVWILNTGWTNGGYGKGPRFPIKVSRIILSAIQSGQLDEVEMSIHPVFGFEVPKRVEGVEDKYLEIPKGESVQKLAQLFIENANKKQFPKEVIEQGGPKSPK